ncbi:MAG: hypothetical protein GWN88_00915 [Nitrospinaceae bacterium]|nr:hypothetical protein [Nitrospinaceae bacterium]NIU42888.1 hypothetical protein [Nitrospinaceae bacterium]NIU94960.1 hypothetical protein [Nitrospinaceae bacterium]NIW57661.1 hypothetical protein [Nitrospinaceae bacterium]
MKHLTANFAFIFVLLLIAFTKEGLASPPLPLTEPELKTSCGWNLKSNGLLYINYDLNGNGKPDYYTVHFVLKAYLSSEPVKNIRDYYPGAPVFYVNYGPANQVYVISRKALFYVFDVDEDGIWDLMYKDIQEDGVNGNETYYGSPSNMFSAKTTR